MEFGFDAKTAANALSLADGPDEVRKRSPAKRELDHDRSVP